MTIEEIKNLQNGTKLKFDGDDIAIFTKEETGILCNYKGDAKLMPFEVVEIVKARFSVAK